MPYSPSIPMRSPPDFFKSLRLDQTRLPRRGHQWRIDLDRQVIGKRFRAVCTDPVDHALQAIAEAYLALVAEESASLVRRARRVPHLARPDWHVYRVEIERHQLRENASELVDRDRFLVGTNVDHFPVQAGHRSHLYQRIHAILYEREAARL